MTRAPKICSLLVAAAMVLGACGEDDPLVQPPGETTTPAPVSPFDEEGFCTAAVAFATPGAPDIAWGEATVEEITQELQDYAADTLRPLVTDLQTTSPEHLRGFVDRIAVAIDRAIETGDIADLGVGETAQRWSEVNEEAAEICDWQTVDITASEYAYDGLPDTLDPVIRLFRLANEGDEPHELVLFRRHDDEDRPFTELLEESDELLDHAEFISRTFALPGQDGATLADLAPGDYVAVCFIPAGAAITATPIPEGAEDAVLHWEEGMLHEFTVE